MDGAGPAQGRRRMASGGITLRVRDCAPAGRRSHGEQTGPPVPGPQAANGCQDDADHGRPAPGDEQNSDHASILSFHAGKPNR
jgi:hypothetical protein